MSTPPPAAHASSAAPVGSPAGTRQAAEPRVAYMMSRFPKITETFVLYEMAALERMGVRVEVFPLLRQPPGKRHPEAAVFEERAHFVPLLSPRVVLSNIKRFLRMPGRYVGTWSHVLRGTWGSAKFFVGALAYFPKCVVFAERMERLRVDHIHAHFAHHPAMAALVVHRLTGIPFSFTAHGSDLHVDRRMLPKKVAEAAFVATVSEYNRALIAGECEEDVDDKLVVIHCGADPAVFADRGGPADVQQPREGTSLRIVCVASFEEVKGHRFLIRACKLLVDAGVDLRCDLAGGGPLRADVEAMIDAFGLQDRVRIHGAVPQADVRRLLTEANVAVLASHPTPSGRREGIPVALMEAMLSGLPVVASGLSGIPELVEDGRTGFLVVPGDPWSLAAKLERLALDPELRQRMGAAGRRKVVSEFDLSTGARLLLGQIRGASDETRVRVRCRTSAAARDAFSERALASATAPSPTSRHGPPGAVRSGGCGTECEGVASYEPTSSALHTLTRESRA